MKTAVDKVSKGNGRVVNTRFFAMTAHYLFDPDFCNVASGWEKGVAEKRRRESNLGLYLIYQPFNIYLCYFCVISKYFHRFKKDKYYARLSLNSFTKGIKCPDAYNHMYIHGKSINFLLAY